MVVPAHHIMSLDTVEAITPANYGQTSKVWHMFFTAVGANYIRNNDADVPNNCTALDGELAFIIFTRVHADYQHHLDGFSSGLACWKKVSEFCVKSTLTTMVVAWQEFTSLSHDTDRPIGVYLAKSDELVATLNKLGHCPADGQIMFNLLAHLDPIFSSVRKGILNINPTPDLASVKATLAAECGDPTNPDPVTVKSEGAYAARSGSYTPSYPSRARAGGNNTRSGDTDRRFRWCSAVHPDQCRRCGISGHISDRCIFDMPQPVRDWVMSGPPKSGGSYRDRPSSPEPDHAATAESARLASLALQAHAAKPVGTEAHVGHSAIVEAQFNALATHYPDIGPSNSSTYGYIDSDAYAHSVDMLEAAYQAQQQHLGLEEGEYFSDDDAYSD